MPRPVQATSGRLDTVHVAQILVPEHVPLALAQ